jgi:hypothetical protein
MRIYAVKATLGSSLKSNNCLIITRKDFGGKIQCIFAGRTNTQ